MRIGTIVLTVGLLVCGGAVGGDGPEPSARPRRKVLVELFTSQGCNSCPAAEKVLGELLIGGKDRSRIVPIAFHVDYFNKPWKDPYSNPAYSRREMEYSLIHQKKYKIEKPDYLYFTPMLMIDGRFPMLGSNVAELRTSLGKALAEKPEASIEASWNGAEVNRNRVLRLRIAANSSELASRRLLVGVAVTENATRTRVESGENSGKTLDEHVAARSFEVKPLRLENKGAKTLEFSLTRPPEVEGKNLSVAVFVQSVVDGRIHQAESIEWEQGAR